MRTSSKPAATLPKKFSKYFWDVNFSQLDLKKHKNFVLERMLNYGTLDTFKWIVNSFKKEEVKKLLTGSGRNSLSHNSYLFWQKIIQERTFWK